MKNNLPITIAILILFFARAAWAGDTAGIDVTGGAFRMTFEEVELPNEQDMGFWGNALLYDASDWFALGPAAYGAATGKRGGFITLGLASEIKKNLTQRFSIVGGLFIGGGGGGLGVSDLNGSGLMLRSSAELNFTIGDIGDIGIGGSHIRFPDGAIDSTQGYISYRYPFDTLIAPGWFDERFESKTATKSVSVLNRDLAVTYRYYDIPSVVKTNFDERQHDVIGLVGAEWNDYINDHLFFKIESHGAFQGKSNGFMQIFLGAGYRFHLINRTYFKLSGGLGVGGGGKVDTGGGFLINSDAMLQQYLTKHLFLSAGGGYINAPDGSFRALSANVKIGHTYTVPAINKSTYTHTELSDYILNSLRIRLSHQTYFANGDGWRTHHSDLDIDNIGFQVDYFPSKSIYLTGQGLAAYARGKAGDYMKGLVGTGIHLPFPNVPLFLDLEMLAGAAGGGGLAVGGGFVWQTNAGVGIDLTDSFSLIITAGHIDAPGGDFESTVLGAAFGFRFGMYAN